MTSQQIIILSSVAAYFVAMIVMGIFASRNQSHEGFVIGSRDVGYIPTIGSISAGFRDGMGLVFWIGFGAVAGYGGMWFICGVLAGLSFYAAIGPRMRDLSEQHDFITIGQMLQHQLGDLSEKITGVYILIFSLLLVAVQLYVSGNLFATILGMDAYIGVFSVAIVVCLYLFFGGYSTVVKTDAVQFFLIISLIMVPLFFFQPPKSEWTNLGSLFTSPFKDSFTLALIGLAFVLSSADVWQRVFSARNKKIIQYSFPLAAVFLGAMTLSLIWLGMAAKPYMNADMKQGEILFAIFSGDFVAVPLLAFMATVFMAITMSTLDTNCYLTASTLAKNFLPESFTNTREKYIRFSQIVFVALLGLMSVVALTISDVIKFLFDAAGILYVLAPVYVMSGLGVFKKHVLTDRLISGSVAISGIVYIYMFTGGHFADLIMTMLPALVSICLCVLSVFVSRLWIARKS